MLATTSTLRFRRAALACGALALCATADAAAPRSPCSLVTAAEFTAIVGAKPDGAPVAGGSSCTVTFDRWQRTAQVQIVDGFGEGDTFASLVKFWREENARARKNGARIVEQTVRDAFCEAKEPTFTSPETRCLRELPGRRVLYATITAPKPGAPPAVAATLKLLDTATPRAR
jgi:hypothetical protein